MQQKLQLHTCHFVIGPWYFFQDNQLNLASASQPTQRNMGIKIQTSKVGTSGTLTISLKQHLVKDKTSLGFSCVTLTPLRMKEYNN